MPPNTNTHALHFFPKKLEMLFMPFLLTLARLLCAWLMGCFALAAAAAASAFVCGGPRTNATPATGKQEKGTQQKRTPASGKGKRGGEGERKKGGHFFTAMLLA